MYPAPVREQKLGIQGTSMSPVRGGSEIRGSGNRASWCLNVAPLRADQNHNKHGLSFLEAQEAISTLGKATPICECCALALGCPQAEKLLFKFLSVFAEPNVLVVKLLD